MSLGSTVGNVWRAAWDALVRLNHLVTETGNSDNDSSSIYAVQKAKYEPRPQSAGTDRQTR